MGDERHPARVERGNGKHGSTTTWWVIANDTGSQGEEVRNSQRNSGLVHACTAHLDRSTPSLCPLALENLRRSLEADRWTMCTSFFVLFPEPRLTLVNLVERGARRRREEGPATLSCRQLVPRRTVRRTHRISRCHGCQRKEHAQRP